MFADTVRGVLETIRRDEPDLVLLDEALPFLSAGELVRIIRGDETLSHLPQTFLLVAHPTRWVVEEARQAGIDAMITKPVIPVRLIRTLEHLQNTRAINRHINPRLRISYDTSTPFRMIRWHRVYTVPSFSPSPLGDLMTMGDICVRNTSFANTRRDQQSNHYLNHHNLAALCYGVALANRVFDSEGVTKKHTIAEHVGKA